MSSSLCCACIFDMDDTLVRTDILWRNAEKQLLKFCDRSWSPRYDYLFKGLCAKDIVHTAKAQIGIEHDPAQMLSVLRDALLEQFREQLLQPVDGALELVRRCADLVPVSVASGSPQEAIEYAMRRLGLFDRFNVVLSSESVSRGKPFPDVFLEAARLMKIAPARCLVFEDSVPGAQAAGRAGARCILRPSLPIDEPPSSIDFIVASWDQVDNAYLQRTFIDMDSN